MTARLLRFDPPFLLCDVGCAVLRGLRRILLPGLCCLLLGFSGCCCRESTMIIRLHAVPLSGCQAEIVRAEKAILDFGFSVESVDFGCRNGTFIDVTVTGRAKRWVEKYTEERQKRIHLEEQLGEGK